MRLEPVGTLAPKSLIDARIELHWAVQILAAVGATWSDAREDDSHMNLGWRSEIDGFVGHSAIGLRVRDLTLVELRDGAVAAEFPLAGRTLAEGLSWADA